MFSPRHRGIALVVATLAIGAVAANAWADLQLQDALRISPGNEFTKRAYPLTVRAGLLVVVALVAVVAAVSSAPAIYQEITRERRALGRWTWTVTGIVALLGLPFGPVPAVLGGLLALAAAMAVRPVVGDHDPSVLRAALTGYLLRAVAGFGIGLVGLLQHGIPIVFDDERAFHEAGLQLPAILVGGYGDLDFGVQHVIGHFLDVVGLIYLLLGPDFVVVRLLNALLGALTVAISYVLARHLFSARSARVVAWCVAVWPAFVFWGGAGLRDAYTVLLGLLIPWLVVRSQRAPLAERALAILAGAVLILVSMASVRWYTAFALILALGVGALVALSAQWLAGRLGAAAAVGGGVVLILATVTLGSKGDVGLTFLDQLTPRALEYRVAVMQLTPLIERDPAKQPPKPDESYLSVAKLVRARSADRPGLQTAIIADYLLQPKGYAVVFADGRREDVAFDTVEPLSEQNVGWQDVLVRVPTGAAIALVPFSPGQGRTVQRLISSPDTVAFDGLVLLAAIGVWRHRRTRSFVWWTLLVYLLEMLAIVVAFSTNLGTALRQRTSEVPWLVLLAAPVLAALWERVSWRVRSGERPQEPERPTHLPTPTRAPVSPTQTSSRAR